MSSRLGTGVTRFPGQRVSRRAEYDSDGESGSSREILPQPDLVRMDDRLDDRLGGPVRLVTSWME